MNRLTDHQKREFVDKIINSRGFSKATTSSGLLKFIFEATIHGENLKETSIESDFFKDDHTQSNNSSKVRVNIYNLRKKLDSYYESEGKDDKWRVELRKGQYKVEFIEQQKQRPRYPVKVVFRYLLLGILLIVLINTILPKKISGLWSEIFRTEPTLYIGDSFGFMGKTPSGEVGWIRDYTINTIDEFYALKESSTQENELLQPASYKYVTGMGVFAARALTKYITPYHLDYSIRFLSESTITEIKEGNSIYVGPRKNNNFFVQFYNTSSKFSEIHDNGDFSIKGHTNINDTCFSIHTNREIIDYTIVAKIDGPNKTKQMLFLSDHDMGVKSTIELFTDPILLNNFCDEHHINTTQNFTAIFKAEGIQRTSTALSCIMVITE